MTQLSRNDVTLGKHCDPAGSSAVAGTVVVCAERSPAGMRALKWAAAEARRQGSPLTVRRGRSSTRRFPSRWLSSRTAPPTSWWRSPTVPGCSWSDGPREARCSRASPGHRWTNCCARPAAPSWSCRTTDRRAPGGSRQRAGHGRWPASEMTIPSRTLFSPRLCPAGRRVRSCPATPIGARAGPLPDACPPPRS